MGSIMDSGYCHSCGQYRSYCICKRDEPAARRQHGSAAQAVAWVRCRPDGSLTKEFLPDSNIEPVRKNSGGWVPLGRIDLAAPPVADTEGVKDAPKHHYQSLSIAPMRESGLFTDEADEFIRLMSVWRHARLGDESRKAFSAVVDHVDAALSRRPAAEPVSARIDARQRPPEPGQIVKGWDNGAVWMPIPSEQPAAAGNALANHPPTAQGEGLTEEVRKLAEEMMVSNRPHHREFKVANALLTIAAHTRASDGKDAEPDWKNIAYELSQRVNMAITHGKFGTGMMLDEGTKKVRSVKDWMADAMEMLPGVKVRRDLMDMTTAQRRKAAKAEAMQQAASNQQEG